MVSSYKQMVFSAMEARFRRLFIRIIAVLPGFLIFQIKRPNFLIQKRIFSQSSAYFRYVCFLEADGFLCSGSSIPSPFHTHNCSFAMFSCFSREKLPNFLIQKRIFSQISAYFRYGFFLQADGFISNGSLIPSHFHANNCNFARFFNIFKQFKDKAPI